MCMRGRTRYDGQTTGIASVQHAGSEMLPLGDSKVRSAFLYCSQGECYVFLFREIAQVHDFTA